MTQPPHIAAPYASLTARYLTPALVLLRALGAAVGVVAAALLLVAVLVAVQGRSVETRHADAILVVGAPCGGAAAPDPCPALGHALDLLRRGYAAHILIATDDAEQARTNLLGAGLPAEALLIPTGGANEAQRTRAAANLLRADGMASVLLVGQPSDMLLALKMTRDEGLTAYATPLATEGRIPPVGALLAEAGAYWRYVLLGE